MSYKTSGLGRVWPTATPFQGLKVLDLSRFIAGPHCSMLLAELGADVVKVEKIQGGDDARHLGERVGDDTFYHLAFNRNKRSLAIDFRTDEGKETIRKMVAHADVLVENFRAGTLEAMGLAPDDLLKLNPRLVITRISGFGQTGPWSSYAGLDGIAQAAGGIMSITGEPDAGPMLCGTFVADYGASLYATIAVLSALEMRRQTGKGSVIDVSLLETAATFLMSAIPEQIRTGATMGQCGSRDRFGAPANTFKTADGDWFLVIIVNQSLFVSLADAMNMPQLLMDPRFVSPAARQAHLLGIEGVVAEWFSRTTTAEAMQVLTEHGVPATKVASVADVVNNPQLSARDFFLKCDRSDIGELVFSGIPFLIDNHRPTQGHMAPKLGEHTEEVQHDWLPPSAIRPQPQ